jgi:hypothetical protein
MRQEHWTQYKLLKLSTETDNAWQWHCLRLKPAYMYTPIIAHSVPYQYGIHLKYGNQGSQQEKNKNDTVHW